MSEQDSAGNPSGNELISADIAEDLKMKEKRKREREVRLSRSSSLFSCIIFFLDSHYLLPRELTIHLIMQAQKNLPRKKRRKLEAAREMLEDNEEEDEEEEEGDDEKRGRSRVSILQCLCDRDQTLY